MWIRFASIRARRASSSLIVASRRSVAPMRACACAQFADAPFAHVVTALVVDDVSSNRKLIAFHVRKLGFEVELAEDGAEAVAAHSRKRARTGGGGLTHRTATAARLGRVEGDPGLPSGKPSLAAAPSRAETMASLAATAAAK